MAAQHYKDPSQPATLPFSAAVAAGDLVFVSGQVAKGDDGNIILGDIEAHTRQTLRNVERALALAGCRTRATSRASIASMRSSSRATSRRAPPRRRSWWSIRASRSRRSRRGADAGMIAVARMRYGA